MRTSTVFLFAVVASAVLMLQVHAEAVTVVNGTTVHAMHGVTPTSYARILPLGRHAAAWNLSSTWSSDVLPLTRHTSIFDIAEHMEAHVLPPARSSSTPAASAFYRVYACRRTVYARYVEARLSLTADAVVGNVSARIYSNLTGTWAPCSVEATDTAVTARCPTTPAMVNGSALLNITIDGSVVGPRSATLDVVVVDRGYVAQVLASYGGDLPWDAGWARAEDTHAEIYTSRLNINTSTMYEAVELSCYEQPPWASGPPSPGGGGGSTPPPTTMPGIGTIDIPPINVSVNITIPKPPHTMAPLRISLDTPEGIAAAAMIAAIFIALTARMGFTDGATLSTVIVTMLGIATTNPTLAAIGIAGFSMMMIYRFIKKRM